MRNAAILSVALAAGVGPLHSCRRPPAQAENTVEPTEEPDMEIEVASREVVIDGSRVHYLAAGPDSGATVLLLHGASFQASTWEELGTIVRLAEEGYSVIALDLPGYGTSERGSMAPAEFLPELLDALSLERPVVVSPSMSGGYSLPLVARHAERLAGFVPVAPVAIDRHVGELEGNELPALLIWGSDDRIVPLARADELTGAMRNARKVVIEDAGHACYMKQPDRFHELLLEFLQGVAR